MLFRSGGGGGHAQVMGFGRGDLATRWRSQPLVLVCVLGNLVIITLVELTEASRSHKFSDSFPAPSWFRVYDIWGSYTYFFPGAPETLLGGVYARSCGDTGHSAPHSPQGYTFACLCFGNFE